MQKFDFKSYLVELFRMILALYAKKKSINIKGVNIYNFEHISHLPTKIEVGNNY